MAINLNTQYPGRTAGTNTNYPFGQGRNVSTQGDGTGTPFESAWFNDVYGFLQALLQGASLTPSGTPDNARASQYLQALQALLLTQTTGDARYLNQSSNLSDLPNAGTARTNLGLGTAATRSTGTIGGRVPLLGTPGTASSNGNAAVIDLFGSNGNGNFIRFTNGLRVQFGTRTGVNGSTYGFPVSFTSIPSLVMSSHGERGNFEARIRSVLSSSQFSYVLPGGGFPNFRISWLAIGS